jgi:hypothetical protein
MKDLTATHDANGFRKCAVCPEAHCEREFRPESDHPCQCCRCIGLELFLEIREGFVAEAKRIIEAEADAAHRAWRAGRRTR